MSYWWSSEATDTDVITRCHLRHVAGHERTSSMSLPVTGPPKSSKTQAHAGTRSFNNRLTLSDVLGIQTTDDLDGADGDGGETLTVEQVAEIQSLILRAGASLASVLKVGKADSLEAVGQDRYDLIHDTLKVKAIRREAEADA